MVHDRHHMHRVIIFFCIRVSDGTKCGSLVNPSVLSFVLGERIFPFILTPVSAILLTSHDQNIPNRTRRLIWTATPSFPVNIPWAPFTHHSPSPDYIPCSLTPHRFLTPAFFVTCPQISSASSHSSSSSHSSKRVIFADSIGTCQNIVSHPDKRLEYELILSETGRDDVTSRGGLDPA